METYGPIDADEASQALAAVRHSRTRVAWSGYPAWYWLTTGVLGGLLITVDHAASRARGVCEGWIRTARTHRDGIVLGGPAAVVMLAGAAAAKLAPGPWLPAVTAVLVSVLFAGTGLTLSARAARQ